MGGVGVIEPEACFMSPLAKHGFHMFKELFKNKKYLTKTCLAKSLRYLLIGLYRKNLPPLLLNTKQI